MNILDLASLGDEYPPEVLLPGAEVLLKYAQENAPVDTGELRESGRIEGTSVVFDAPHAVPVEIGTRFMQAQPYLSKAAFEHADEIDAAIMDAIEAEIERRV